MQCPCVIVLAIVQDRERPYKTVRDPLRPYETDLVPKYIEKYSNTLQLHVLSLINDYNYITITGPVEM